MKNSNPIVGDSKTLEVPKTNKSKKKMKYVKNKRRNTPSHAYASPHSHNSNSNALGISSVHVKYSYLLASFFHIIGRTFVKYIDYSTLDNLVNCKPLLYTWNDIMADYKLILSFCNGFQERTTKTVVFIVSKEKKRCFYRNKKKRYRI